MSSHRSKIRLTRSGKILFFLGIFLLFAAQNTGNNLLYLMSSCFFACLTWSGVISWRNLSGLKIELLLPDYYFAGQQDAIRCRIEDLAGRPRFFIGFEQDFAEFLPAGNFLMLKSDLQASQRGSHKISGFKVFSVYPVDLFICTCEILPVDFQVGPRPAFRIPEVLSREEGGAVDQLLSGKEGDYWMQKPYQEGEDASLINWSMSARSLTEWVLVKSVKFGMNKKLCFDFAGIEGQMFEDCLEIAAGLILRLRQHDIDGFVWAFEEQGGYCWQSVIFDLPSLASWLAKIQSGQQPLPEDADVEVLRFSDIYRSFS
ncbi:MAG: hypothetical protein CVV41_01765 [Candidatus Riflebacteria bacterium HGW-Riflebacteria-1]|nr:MAG: hypothetical protein CVV41_01765 [Candidatus Riflebacteria bacterium HGW-Riflebacteria-1]